jgi:Flp pilus assembly protein TadG
MDRPVTAENRGEMARTPWAGARGGGRDGGSALVEFALVLPLLLVMTVAVVDFGRAFFVMNVLGQSAREGVRLLAVSSTADSLLVRQRVLEVANASGVTVRGLTLSGPDAARQVRVVVQGEFNWIFPGVFNLFGAGFSNPMTLTGRAVMRSE